jgi:hypothetical protein
MFKKLFIMVLGSCPVINYPSGKGKIICSSVFAMPVMAKDKKKVIKNNKTTKRT